MCKNGLFMLSDFSHEYLPSGLFSHGLANVFRTPETNPQNMKQSRYSAKTRVNEKYNNGHTRK